MLLATLVVAGTVVLRSTGSLPPGGVPGLPDADPPPAAVPTPTDPDSAAIAWLAANAVSLWGVEAGLGFEDLQPLRDVVGDARVVALGEATHGTREFFRMKHRMLEFLVAEMGFTAFAMEATLPEAFDVDRWVLTGDGDPERALAGLYFWTWNTEEVMDLLEWMRAWNADRSHARKVRFYGVDMQSPTRAAKIALDALSRVEPRVASELRGRLAAVTSAYDASGLPQLPIDARRELLEAARAVESALRERGPALADACGEEGADRACRCARVLVQNLELRTDETATSYERRDRAMAENLLWALDREGPHGKIALWAHNGHVATAAGAMGGHLRAALGDGLRVFALSFYEGSFQAINWPPPRSGLTTFVAPPALAGTLDAALAAAGLYVAALDLRALPADGPVAEWFAGERGMRSIGAVASSRIAALAYDRRPVRDRFDGLLFVRTTSAARAMPSAARRPVERLAGPSNLGFEQGEPGFAPADWRISRERQEALGYRVQLSSKVSSRGSRSLHVLGLPGPRYGESWGGARQSLAPEPYRGRRVRLAGRVRADGTMAAHVAIQAGSASLPTSGPARSGTTRGRKRWTRLAAEMDVPEDAIDVTLEVGAEGVGDAWFDDLSLEILDDPGG